MPKFTQQDRLVRIKSALDDDTLLVERMTVTEVVSGGFEMQLDLLSPDHAINGDDVLRMPVTIDVYSNEMETVRHFNGFVSRFVQLESYDELTRYRIAVVPRSWFLSLGRDCRIFQNKSVLDIVKEVLKDAGIHDVRDACTGSYEVREYCVQYRESDLAFISRLLEEVGIFYFYEHDADKHTLVLGDNTSAIKPGPTESLPMSFPGAAWTGAAITTLELESNVCIGELKLVDYNDEKPKLALHARVDATAHVAAGTDLRVYDYPGKFAAVDAATKIARVRMEEHEVFGTLVRGTTNERALGCGQKLTIKEHQRGDLNRDYHLISVTHTSFEPPFRTAVGVQPASFEASFIAIPHDVPFRPARTTPLAIARGTQPAVVVGPSGEEIHVDKYGRVKVQFFWDEIGNKDEKSSCWVRVSTAWAGKAWGIIQIPRIGQEVLIEFIEGDPDRPIITGRVYNADQPPPYTLPDHGTQSGMKTRSSKGGEPDNANELRFEDLKGKEMVYFQAEKDLSSVVKNDETREVRHDRTTTIKNDEKKTITEGNETITISKGDQTFTIEQGKQTISVYQDLATTVEQGKHTLTVKMGDAETTISMGNLTTKVDMGNISVKAGLGKITVEAMQAIELKVGPSSIKIDPAGVTIEGMKVSINGKIQTEIKSVMTQINGDGMLMLKGGLTMIN